MYWLFTATRATRGILIRIGFFNVIIIFFIKSWLFFFWILFKNTFFNFICRKFNFQFWIKFRFRFFSLILRSISWKLSFFSRNLNITQTPCLGFIIILFRVSFFALKKLLNFQKNTILFGLVPNRGEEMNQDSFSILKDSFLNKLPYLWQFYKNLLC